MSKPSISLTCKTLHQISKSITLQRSLDASRSLENLPIPFHNTVDEHPYAHFDYTPSQILPFPSPSTRLQSWGGSNLDNSLSQLARDSVSLVDVSGDSVSGCCCERCEKQVGVCPCSIMERLEIASECGRSCQCELECGNRLTQRGILVELKIVRVESKGWGLFAAQFIGQGQFVCEYAGMVHNF
ncbi:Pre-SET domain-containing protein [Cephalotus follicularis]|uniref:Pre-SET domain-containing protein n=1 Tax=Cephalotus follicularis TaxID=3775 RepID=A0A1Q3DBY5_CEPFO|nr:Pre-SET domain-containing protein [Cephalotus follicularis]